MAQAIVDKLERRYPTILGDEPGYYANGSYFGRKNVLAVGAGLRTAPQTIGPKETPGDLWGWTVDAFFEHALGEVGVLTLEAALFRYYATLTEPGWLAWTTASPARSPAMAAMLRSKLSNRSMTDLHSASWG